MKIFARIAGAVGMGSFPIIGVVLAVIATGAAVTAIADQALEYSKENPRQAPAVAANPNVKPPGQTFRVALDGQRVQRVTIRNVEIGAQGLTQAILVQGATATEDTYIGTLTISGLSCPSVTVSNVNVHDATVSTNTVDGLSLNWVTDATVSDIVLGSTRGTVPDISLTDSTVDRIIIEGTGTIDELVLADVQAFGAPCLFDELEVGTLRLTDSVAGDGTGIGVPSFTVATTTRVASQASVGNIEKAIRIQ